MEQSGSCYKPIYRLVRTNLKIGWYQLPHWYVPISWLVIRVRNASTIKM